MQFSCIHAGKPAPRLRISRIWPLAAAVVRSAELVRTSRQRLACRAGRVTRILRVTGGGGRCSGAFTRFLRVIGGACPCFGHYYPLSAGYRGWVSGKCWASEPKFTAVKRRFMCCELWFTTRVEVGWEGLMNEPGFIDHELWFIAPCGGPCSVHLCPLFAGSPLRWPPLRPPLPAAYRRARAATPKNNTPWEASITASQGVPRQPLRDSCSFR